MKDADLVRISTILFQALLAPIGLCIRTNDAREARKKFYEAKRTNVAFQRLQFRLSSWDENLLLITKGEKLPNEDLEIT